MSVNYKLYQNKNKKSSAFGKYFARSVMNGVINLDGLAKIIQSNCTVKKSDVLAVLSELTEVMSDQLQSSMKVKLDGFGAFKIGLHSTGSATVKDFSPTKNIKGMHVNFQPEAHVDSATHTRSLSFLSGAKLQEQENYQAPKDPAAKPAA